jgi:hypothetical protein
LFYVPEHDHGYARTMEEAGNHHGIGSPEHGQHAMRCLIVDGTGSDACIVRTTVGPDTADVEMVVADGDRDGCSLGPAPGKSQFPPCAQRPAS